MIPWRNDCARVVCVASVRSSSGRVKRVFTPVKMRYATPPHLMALKRLTDVARTALRPRAASDAWIMSPISSPATVARPCDRPSASVRLRLRMIAGPGMRRSTTVAPMNAIRFEVSGTATPYFCMSSVVLEIRGYASAKKTTVRTIHTESTSHTRWKAEADPRTPASPATAIDNATPIAPPT